MGAEGPGLSPAALDRTRNRVRIPMATGVDSLNVAVAAAIAFARFARPGAALLEVSARTGMGLDAWVELLENRRQALLDRAPSPGVATASS